MVNKVPDFNIGKYKETGELGKHLDKSLLSGTSKETTLSQGVSIVIDNLVHNLMAICFQVETCVKSLAEGKFKWVNKEDVVQDLHNEVNRIFHSIKTNSRLAANLKDIEKNLAKFEEVYEILQRAGVDKETIEDIKTQLKFAKIEIDTLRKQATEEAAEALIEMERKELKPTKFTRKEAESLFSRQDSIIHKKEFQPEELPAKHPERVKKEREEKYEAKADRLREESKSAVSGDVKARRREFEGRAKDKASFEKFETEKLPVGHPSRLKKEKTDLKAQVKLLERELKSLEREKPQLKQRDENGKELNFPLTPKQARAEKERVAELKAQIPGVKKQLGEAKALLEKTRADLRKRDTPTKIEKRKLKQEIKEAKANVKLLKQEHEAAKEDKTPAERKLIREALANANDVLSAKKAAYEDFKKKH